MVEIGSGTGTSYPGGLDTNNTAEINSPNAGKTKARAEVVNDLASSIIAVQTELGTDPAGSLTDVKTFLQVEHNLDGTHTGIFSATNIPGYKDKGIFQWNSTTDIVIYPSVYHHQGATEQLVYWDGALTKTFTGLTATAWHFLYIDDSAIISSGTNLLTASELINSVNAPAYSSAKHGYYFASDRCIAAFRTNSSSQIEKFVDFGNGWIQPQGWQAGVGFDKFLTTGPATSYTALSPDVPIGCTAIQVNAQHGSAHSLYLSTDGTTDDLYVEGSGADSHVLRTALNASRQIYYKMGAGSINLLTSQYFMDY